MINRRRMLVAGTGTVLASPFLGRLAAQAAGLALPSGLPQGVRDEAVLDALPGKKPLIKLSYRPPNYESPLDVFGTPITPNESFFVRYHLADIPQVDAAAWTLAVGGEAVDTPTEMTLAQLKQMPAAEVVAVCQCAGNRRGLFHPHVAGVEWGSGAMGCARWRGVRLKDLLDKAGLKKSAIEIVVNGADGPAVDKTPDFVKSVPVWKAVEDTTLIAYEMNGQPLPHLNGFPARLIVPGWTGTYWMKHITSIAAITKPFDGFWMKSAYRIPLGKFPLAGGFTSQTGDLNTPITEMVVNSLITSPGDNATLRAGRTATVSGIAWDGGHGVQDVQVSLDGGRSWLTAQLGEDLGPFAFRTWSVPVAPRAPGTLEVMARASNKIGQTQTAELIQNPAGYHNNTIQKLTLTVV